MRIKKKNVARLASLSALGAGAVAATAVNAEAGVVSYSFPSGTIVSAELGNFNSIPLIPVSSWASSLLVKGGGYTVGYVSRHVWGVKFVGPQFLKTGTGSFLGLFNLGDKWNSGPAGYFLNIAKRIVHRNSYPIYSRTTQYFTRTPTASNPATTSTKQYYRRTGTGWSNTNATVQGNAGFDDKYALFHFQDPTGSMDYYGWLEMSMSVSGDPQGFGSGPDVTLLGYAYDTLGSKLAAGDTGDTGGTIPEPSTMALTGLAALALGATGLRRWRAACKSAA